FGSLASPARISTSALRLGSAPSTSARLESSRFAKEKDKQETARLERRKKKREERREKKKRIRRGGVSSRRPPRDPQIRPSPAQIRLAGGRTGGGGRRPPRIPGLGFRPLQIRLLQIWRPGT
uniref:Uncharacterized protein n=1 Tax=Oryza nivara TaxID=4536 RepID=A0A0E0G9I9_ORYNI